MTNKEHEKLSDQRFEIVTNVAMKPLIRYSPDYLDAPFADALIANYVKYRGIPIELWHINEEIENKPINKIKRIWNKLRKLTHPQAR